MKKSKTLLKTEEPRIVIDDKRGSGSGVSARFFKLNSKIDDVSGPFAIKIYDRAGPEALIERNEAYNAQKQAAKLGLAPPTGRKVIGVRNGCEFYGYETKRAKIAKTWQEFARLCDKYGYGDPDDSCDWLGDELKDIGYRNAGFWQGDLVCVDFGDESKLY
jgi:hypothetical protein